MRRAIFVGVLGAQLLGGTSGWAGPAETCLTAADAAEHRWGLPANLLRAIGEVETGRADQVTGRVQPWPWSANAAGAPYIFASAGEADAVVGFLRERGIASIDVGCFQVNLRHHPAAFASVAQGFDPDANADYAGRFLRSLFERSGSWWWAIRAYHSANPALGDDYRFRVLRAWHALPPAQPMPSADPHVIRLTAAAAGIPVYTTATLPAALRAALGLDRARSSRESKWPLN